MSESRCSSGIFEYIGDNPSTPKPMTWRIPPRRRNLEVYDADTLPPVEDLLGSFEKPEPCLVALPAILSRIEKLRRKYKGLPLPLHDTHLSLSSLPLEILQIIFRDTTPHDLASLSISCSALNDYIRHDTLLWRHMYLATFACPKKGILDSGFDWKLWAQKLYRTWNILRSEDDNLKWRNIDSIAESVMHMLQTDVTTDSSTSNVLLLDILFTQSSNYDTLLCHSNLHQWARTEPLGIAPGADAEEKQTLYPSSSMQSQLSAKLHCLGGALYHMDENPWDSSLFEDKITACAESRVYDWRQFGLANRFGPFVDNHTLRVDWEKMEAIQCVLSAGCQTFMDNVWIPGDGDSDRIITDAWEDPFEGVTPGSFVTPIPRKVISPLDARDPYNVTGTWIRILCCPNYHQLLAFNKPDVEPPENQPRPPWNGKDSFALMGMELRVTHVEPMYARGFGALPVVHFEGTRWYLANTEARHPNGKSRGTVSLTSEGEVWWTSFEMGQGAEPWECQGIQIGGLNSARGVFGMWSRRGRRSGEAELGPTAFRKEKDTIDS